MAFLGRSSRQVTARAVAKGRPIGYAVVGLDSITMNGNSASYASGGGGSTSKGHIASNGNISLGGSAYINGTAYAGSGKSVTGGTVTGGRNNLTTPLGYPDGDAGVYATTNSNGNVAAWAWAYPGASTRSVELFSGETLTLPGGNYYFQNVSMQGGSTMRFTGPATIYCYGTFEMYGQTETSGSVPGNLRLIMCNRPDGTAPGAVTLAGGAALYASVYAPRSAITISGNADIYGSVLGKSIYMGGNGTVHYDLSLDSAHGTIAIVQ